MIIITPLYAGLLALLFLALSFRVVFRRREQKINLGDGGDAEMQRRVRGHGNFAEYVPLILVLIALLELGRTTPGWALHAMGITLVIARLLHGYALSFSKHFFLGRFIGTILTFTLLLVAGGLCVMKGLSGL